MISSKSLKYTVRILLGTLIGVYLGIIVLLNIPYVKGKLSVFVTKELKNILNTEVSVGPVSYTHLYDFHSNSADNKKNHPGKGVKRSGKEPVRACFLS